MLPDEVAARLRFEAMRRGVSIAEVAREALEKHLPEGPRDLAFFAIGDGAPGDVAKRVDHYVAKAITRRKGSKSRSADR